MHLHITRRKCLLNLLRVMIAGETLVNLHSTISGFLSMYVVYMYISRYFLLDRISKKNGLNAVEIQVQSTLVDRP